MRKKFSTSKKREKNFLACCCSINGDADCLLNYYCWRCYFGWEEIINPELDSVGILARRLTFTENYRQLFKPKHFFERLHFDSNLTLNIYLNDGDWHVNLGEERIRHLHHSYNGKNNNKSIFFISAQRVDVMLCSCRMARTLLFSNGHSIGKISQLPRRHCYTLFGSRKTILFDFNFEIYPSFSVCPSRVRFIFSHVKRNVCFRHIQAVGYLLVLRADTLSNGQREKKNPRWVRKCKAILFLFSDYWTVPIGVRMEIISIVGSFWSDFGV